ncbi:MAG: M20/M25/M40 family metallo-hydrolase [Oceanospirillaceae bacterium]|nr:M20/M25/M40 family metallo-hydrolase [Oceanospirillaceae bacterium]
MRATANTNASTSPLYQQLIEHLDPERAIAMFKGAIACNSVTGNEASVVAFLKTQMQALNLDPKTADFLPDRPNLWGEFAGAGTGKRLLFIGHTDTVHVRGWSEHWAGDPREDPFAGTIIDGEIWGRGSGDLKAGITASLLAVELIKKAGIKLKGDVSFAFVGDEESGECGTGVSAGAKDYIRRVLADEIPRPDFAVYVEPTQLAVYPAQMGFFIADVKITGKSAYFGVPEQGVDALKAAHRALSALWEHSDDIAARAEHDLVGRAFVLVTAIEAGGSVAVPGEASFSLIRKLLPGESLDEAVAELEAVIQSSASAPGIKIDISEPAGRDHKYGGSPAQIPLDSPVIGLLASALEEAMPGRGQIEGAPYWSEAPFLIKELNCPTLYCAPGNISNCHTFEERVNIEEFLAGVIAYAVFIVQYCGIAK